MWLGRFLSVLLVALSTLAILPASAETFQVTIDKLEFIPAKLKAKVGDTIEWLNKDIFAHTATARGDLDVTIPPKKTASFVLKEPGDVEYYCRFHPNMKGRVSVAPR